MTYTVPLVLAIAGAIVSALLGYAVGACRRAAPTPNPDDFRPYGDVPSTWSLSRQFAAMPKCVTTIEYGNSKARIAP